jgi:hypothetical protein
MPRSSTGLGLGATRRRLGGRVRPSSRLRGARGARPGSTTRPRERLPLRSMGERSTQELPAGNPRDRARSSAGGSARLGLGCAQAWAASPRAVSLDPASAISARLGTKITSVGTSRLGGWDSAARRRRSANGRLAHFLQAGDHGRRVQRGGRAYRVAVSAEVWASDRRRPRR